MKSQSGFLSWLQKGMQFRDEFGPPIFCCTNIPYINLFKAWAVDFMATSPPFYSVKSSWYLKIIYFMQMDAVLFGTHFLWILVWYLAFICLKWMEKIHKKLVFCCILKLYDAIISVTSFQFPLVETELSAIMHIVCSVNIHS